MLGLLLGLIQIVVGFPMAFINSEVIDNPIVSDTIKKGDLIEPIMDFDFSKSNNNIYILFSKDDLKELPKNIPHKKIIKIDNPDVL